MDRRLQNDWYEGFPSAIEIYWEDVVGGNSVVYLENCLGLPTDPVFVEFVQYFQRMLNARLDNFIDLTM